MASSNQTTDLGPRVSLSTTKGHAHDVTDWARFDLTAARLLPRVNTTSHTSATLNDGEFAISVGVSLTTLYYRSGVTTYQFASDATTVL